jgi:ubiquinone biosynthesis protein UbiJ
MFDAAFLATLDHLLEGATWARDRLTPFAGRHARLVMPPFEAAFVVSAAGRCVAAEDESAPDVIVHLPADAPLRLLQGIDQVMAGGRVEGNAEFATELSFVFRNLRWDAEEDLSHLIGDIAAHRLVQGAERFFGWQRQAAQNFAANFGEYLTMENPLLVSRREFSALREGIARLNADLARLETRGTALKKPL